MFFLDALQNLNATKTGHGDIGNNDVVCLNFKVLKCLLGAVSCMTFVCLTQKIIKDPENGAIIIDK